MDPQALFEAGELDAAVQSLSAKLQQDPSDVGARTFLFQLLCFAGEYKRAQKHLDVLGGNTPASARGVMLYGSALSCEATRHELFDKKEYPRAEGGPGDLKQVSGTLNGKRFRSLCDADPRVGANLELFVGDTYLWIPFRQLASLEIEAPRELRDLIWARAIVRVFSGDGTRDFGRVLLPALCPFTSRHANNLVRLGRMTVWEQHESGVVPVGQKMLLAENEEFPFLEVRRVEFDPPPDLSDSHGRSA